MKKRKHWKHRSHSTKIRRWERSEQFKRWIEKEKEKYDGRQL
jgi:hypothetical protein